MSEGLAGDASIRAVLETVHRVPPTAANAERLWRDYQHSYRGDEDLLLRTCSPEMGIDGLTESLDADGILASMQMPDTLTFEIKPTVSENAGGFVIVRYATQHDESKRGFRAYFLEDVFPQDKLLFRSDADRLEFFGRLEEGLIMYFAEFVSRRGRVASSALMLAAYQEICVHRFGVATCTVLGKCLDSAQVGICKNLTGNRPIKALVESIGLGKIALCQQTRRLDVQDGAPLLERAFPEKAFPPDGCINAILTFALYLGQSQAAVEKIIQQLRKI